MKNLSPNQRQWLAPKISREGASALSNTRVMQYASYCKTNGIKDDSGKLRCWVFAKCGNKPYNSLTTQEQESLSRKLKQEVRVYE